VRSIVFGFLTLCFLVTPALAQVGRAPILSAESVLLLDSAGKVLYAKNPDENHAPASLVKLMTLYLAYQDVGAGRAAWGDPVPISPFAAATPRSRMGLRSGEVVPLSTLVEGVAIASANDAAVAVAEHLAGSEHVFVERMNAKGRQLGLAHTRFANPHGLPDPGQRSTAEDMAVLIRRLMEDHPESGDLLAAQTFDFRGRTYGRRISLFTDPGGLLALKTGFTREAGYNLAISALRASKSVLLIVLGSRTRGLSFLDARKLLRYGFGEPWLESDERPRRTGPPARRGPERRSRPSVTISR
jgi:D-alanyl-D-alanine carboxypeptidase